MNTYGALLAGTPNVVYGGDLQGNLWRVDISNSNPSNWTVSVLFQARDGSGNTQPITVTPAVTLNPLAPQLTGAMVYFGTGQFLGLPDLGNTNVQSVYGGLRQRHGAGLAVYTREPGSSDHHHADDDDDLQRQ